MATTDEDVDDQLTWSPDVPDEVLVEVLERGTAWPGGPGSVTTGTWAVAAAGTWDRLGCVLVLHRTEDGLDHDVHVAVRDRSGRWRPGHSAGTSLPDGVLERPDAGPASWMGTQTQVVADQLLGVETTADDTPHDDGSPPRTRWAACVAVQCSRQVERLQLVHRSPAGGLPREVALPVPPSGLVAFACPVVHHTDSVLLQALGGEGDLLSEETHLPLTELDRHWPDESLWDGVGG